MILKIREDLCAARLSRTITSFFSGYFVFNVVSNIDRYSSKTSFLVPPPTKNLTSSTQLSLIVAQQVIFFYNVLLHNSAG
jgi:hypothetical protein